jgi:RNA polymerase sigma factor (sigma-70 family)
VQETFLDAFTSIDRLKMHGNVGAWLMRAARNNMLDSVRRVNLNYNSEFSEFLFFYHTDKRAAEPNESFQALENILSADEKHLVIMRYRDDYHIKQISSFLDISVNACKLRFHRIRLKVRNSIEAP